MAEIRPVKGQIDDLLHEIRARVEKGERVLVTTLTKRMAEDLAEYYAEVGVKCRYMHSEIETLERVKIFRDLRKGDRQADQDCRGPTPRRRPAETGGERREGAQRSGLEAAVPGPRADRDDRVELGEESQILGQL